MKLPDWTRRGPHRVAAVALVGLLGLTAGCGESVTVKGSGAASPKSSSSASSSAGGSSDTPSAASGASNSSAPSNGSTSGGSPAMQGKNQQCTDALQALQTFDKNAQNVTDPSAIKSGLQSVITRLQKDAGSESDAAAKSAMAKVASDYSQLLTDIDSGKTPNESSFYNDGEKLGENCAG